MINSLDKDQVVAALDDLKTQDFDRRSVSWLFSFLKNFQHFFQIEYDRVFRKKTCSRLLTIILFINSLNFTLS